ncbi:uncharacterized protein TM35_000271640 [Trypanosoma theileri]|uniref:Uncharacterized protein n=1 Tax=Trypanosoma theileri TaxID=67003 RepID=A0A1X0NPG1_9TRYP|nr:uncharacterized protein TM35_000271640 [Trypanosoma theileri]ORC86574.1 hypothetical protein TM35_000271640 [Trypanosoma theileri]
MLLRVRGNGASPENSQAALVFLRGFRLTNTRPPLGAYKTLTGTRPLIYSHFPVGIQAPSATNDVDLGAHLNRTVWKEIWNMYDIVYDELCLFPEPDVMTNLLSSCASNSNSTSSAKVEEVGNFTRLTARNVAKTAVVVTHYFSEDTARPSVAGMKSSVIVLDVSFLPLKDAATRIAVEVAWLAAYASMEGALENVSHVVVRLPYDCDLTNVEKMNSSVVQEGLDFIGEHIELLVQSFRKKSEEEEKKKNGVSSVCVSFIGSNPSLLQERLHQIRSLHPSTSGTVKKEEEKEEEDGITVFTGDHHREELHEQKQEELLYSIASSLGIRVSLDMVPLKSLLEGGEEPWDEATTRENQVLNFCPCCGHCGCH